MTVRAWPALDSKAGKDVIIASFLEDGHALRRSGFGPRLVYVLGGFVDDVLGTVDVYDPMTDGWKQVSSMPTKRCAHGCVALDGKIYAIGGFNGDDGTLNSADVYDPQSDSWQPLAEMASARQEFAAATAGGKIYVIGGTESDDDTTAAVEAFDPLLGTWAEVASMSVARRLHAAAVVDGKIYVLGGYDAGAGSGQGLDSVEMYDPQTDSWQQKTSLPHAGSRHVAAVMGGKIYVSGGYRDGSEASTLLVFDPQANTWMELASMGTARADHASAAIGGKLYVFGGFSNGAERLASVEAYNAISNTWAPVSDLTGARDDFVAVAI